MPPLRTLLCRPARGNRESGCARCRQPTLLASGDHLPAEAFETLELAIRRKQRVPKFIGATTNPFDPPEQRQLVERDYAVPARVPDSAGRGKTIVALLFHLPLPRRKARARPEKGDCARSTFPPTPSLPTSSACDKKINNRSAAASSASNPVQYPREMKASSRSIPGLSNTRPSL